MSHEATKITLPVLINMDLAIVSIALPMLPLHNYDHLVFDDSVLLPSPCYFVAQLNELYLIHQTDEQYFQTSCLTQAEVKQQSCLNVLGHLLPFCVLQDK